MDARRRRVVAFVGAASFVFLLALHAEEPRWGELRGRFVVVGTPPPRFAMPTKNPECCGPGPYLEEAPLVDEGLANVFVWLEPDAGEKLPLHPRGVEKPAPFVLRVKNCRYEPHAFFVRTGQTVRLENEDSCGHNSRPNTFRNVAPSLIPTGSVDHWKFDRVEPGPVSIMDNIHPWMCGWMLIQDHPYVAITDRDGVFLLPEVPAGVRNLRMWHESVGNLTAVTSGDREVRQPKGRRKVTIPAGRAVDLGVMQIAAESLQRKH